MSTSGEVDPSVTSAFGALSIGTTTSASSTSNSTEARKSGVQSIKVEGKEEGKSQQQAKKQPPGASWVDYPNLSQDEKDALTEKKFGVDVVVVKDLVKQFSLPGREEKVRALKGVNLCEGSEIYPIRQVCTSYFLLMLVILLSVLLLPLFCGESLIPRNCLVVITS